MKLKGITILVNYPDESQEAGVPSEMTDEQLCLMIRRLCAGKTKDSQDMTSFVITAVVDK